MNSKICHGRVMHARLEPVHHDFMYRLSFFAFDLDELPAIDRRLSLFGYNRVRPFAIHDADYLDDGPGTIRDKLLSRLKSEGLDKPIERIFEFTTVDRGYSCWAAIINPSEKIRFRVRIIIITLTLI